MKSTSGTNSKGMVSGLAFLMVFLLIVAVPAAAISADRLIIKDGSSATTFTVADNGMVDTTSRYQSQSASPGFWLDETGSGRKGAYVVLDEDWVQVQRRAQGYGAFEASIMFISMDAPNAAFYIATSGYLGLGLAPTHPLHLANGAYNSAGGAWIDGSSRDYKEDIRELSVEEALAAFEDLKPMKFKYKLDPTDDQLGFIAEDVPELVATRDRKGMSPMDVVAVLTKVVQEQQSVAQEQQSVIEKLTERLNELEMSR